MKNNRDTWIDVLKFISIFAVFVDHTRGYLYTKSFVNFSSYFSVSVFVFLSGVTAYYSNIKRMNEPYITNIFYKLKNILLPYILVSCFYIYWINGREILDFKTCITIISNFSAASPFYFIVFFIQLLLVSRVLTKTVVILSSKKIPGIWLLIFACLTLIFCSWTIKHTYILPVHGGGQYLLGCTYLFIYFTGMVFARYYKLVKWSLTGSIITFICSLSCAIFWVCFMTKSGLIIETKIPYWGAGFNPPSVTFFIYSILIITLFWSGDNIVKHLNTKWISIVYEFIGKLGKSSLYIFLFHLQYLCFYKIYIAPQITNINILRLTCILYVFALSILSGKIVDYTMFKLPDKIKELYNKA